MVAIRKDNEEKSNSIEEYNQKIEKIKKQGIITNTVPLWKLFSSQHLMGMVRVWKDLVKDGIVDIKLQIPSKGIIIRIEYKEKFLFSIMTKDGNLLEDEEAAEWCDNEIQKEKDENK